MIVVTGAAGFIGSCFAHFLHSKGHRKLVLVDDFSSEVKAQNWQGLKVTEKVDRNQFFDWSQHNAISAVVHLGARTDTTEQDFSILKELNLDYSQRVWNLCEARKIPLIYASSAATYGAGEHGFEDDGMNPSELRPLNPYGWSKNEMDKWALNQSTSPTRWHAFKFFNVYGPNEYHKGKMASVVFHAFHQIQKSGRMKLFRSHNHNYKDGEQLRDFVYVKDVCEVLYFFLTNAAPSGIYNLGSGKARTFLDLTRAVFTALGQEEAIDFIDTPIEIRDAYQYYTCANMDKLRAVGYQVPFTSLEAGVLDYVRNYLIPDRRME